MLTHRPRSRPGWTRSVTICLAWFGLARTAGADDIPKPPFPPSPPPLVRPASPGGVSVAAVPSDPVFVALLVDGSVVAGRVAQVDQTQGVTLAGPDGVERSVAIDRLVKLTREGTAAPTVVEGGIVLLPHGDRLARCLIGASGEITLTIQPLAIGGIALPLNAMVGLILAPPGDVDAAAALEAKMRGETHDAERIWLGNGDRLDGLFAGLTDKQVLFQPPAGPMTLPRSNVVAVGFDPAQVADQPPRGAFFEWLLLDGSRFGLDQSRFDRGQVVGRTRFGVEVRFPIGEVARCRVLGSSVSYLADRAADKVVYEPYLGPTRPYRRDASVLGSPLRLGGQTYDRGVGTQSRTLLAYRLDPRARRFQTMVGLDDAAGPLGNVVFKVLVDGKPRYESPTMGIGDAPRPVDIDLIGGKVLILITEFGERGDVQDSGDWVEARIIR